MDAITAEMMNIIQPTSHLRWRIATYEDTYVHGLPMAIQNGVHYVLEQMFTVTAVDNSSQTIEWRSVEIGS